MLKFFRHKDSKQYKGLTENVFDSPSGIALTAQVAKMKKSIPDISLPWNLQEWSSWSKKLQRYLKNYGFFVKMWNLGQYREIWYFVNNCLIKTRI